MWQSCRYRGWLAWIGVWVGWWKEAEILDIEPMGPEAYKQVCSRERQHDSHIFVLSYQVATAAFSEHLALDSQPATSAIKIRRWPLVLTLPLEIHVKSLYPFESAHEPVISGNYRLLIIKEQPFFSWLCPMISSLIHADHFLSDKNLKLFWVFLWAQVICP